MPGWMRGAGLLIAQIAGELVPCQGQLDQPLPVGTLGLRGALHSGLGLMLRIVLGVHAQTLAGHLDECVAISSV
ncbi:hypothetical protein AOQ72_30700 [Bradyrhizobium yuanmingense]|uniref:Uncharacterized protein n=1 Tax=Bradyrhizobium yuanmingense TaxID=108015 RepID=A0A0R3C8W4_9BRAD|nr:hypothetical protein AOQ72_30700 [Bradyrhizobium yuanmingense]